MKKNGVIEQKIRLLEAKLEEIESWKIDSYKELEENSMLRNAVERALQVSVEIMIDISERILAQLGAAPKDTAAANFDKLQSYGVIARATDYADMVRFRNFIVHRYEYVDLHILYGIIRNKMHLFAQFIDEIRTWQTNGSGHDSDGMNSAIQPDQ